MKLVKRLVNAIVIVVLSGNSLIAQHPDWNVRPADFENSQVMVGIIMHGDEEIGDANDQLAAFIGGKCRGVASPAYYPNMNRYVITLMVYGNSTEEHSVLSFKYYCAEDDSVYVLPTSEFISNGIVGNYQTPYIWQIERINAIINRENTPLFTINNLCDKKIDIRLNENVEKPLFVELYSLNGILIYQTQIQPFTNSTSFFLKDSGLYVLIIRDDKNYKFKSKIIVN